jgi:hypothetical protein
MPSTQVVQVVVEKLNKFGFYDQTGGVYYSKNLKDADKLKVVPGAKFNAEYYVADSGSRYLNKVFDMLTPTEAVKKETIHAPKATKTEVLKAHAAQEDKGLVSVGGLVTKMATSSTMSKEEWQAKDVRISRQGVIQAAVQALTGVYPTVGDLYGAAEELALKMLDFVNEK